MRKFALGLLLLAGVLFTAGTASAQRGTWVTYTNEAYGYRLLYPAEVFAPASAAAAQGERARPDGGFEDEDDLRGYKPGDGLDEDEEGAGLSGDGGTFVSEDGRAKLVVFGAENTENFTPAEYRSIILKEFAGYDEVTYGPRGSTWFVLSGFRGGDIYYQKVMFSCGGRIINALSITFPRDEKPFYEPIIERVEDNFRPARGQACASLPGIQGPEFRHRDARR
jgi:hypothetical protein